MRLIEKRVQAGDHVKANQVLARFDTVQFELERSQLEAERRLAEVEVRRFVQDGDAAAASLAKANVGVIDTQIAAVDDRIKRCIIRAPSDGVVIEANLSKRVGQIFPQGETILSFSPLDQWEVELQLPEYLASYVQPEQFGEFCTLARPHEKFDFQVHHVNASAQVVGDKNVFVAAASMEESRSWMRVGMEGIAKTNTGWRPVWWIAGHRLYEYARLGFWF